MTVFGAGLGAMGVRVRSACSIPLRLFGSNAADHAAVPMRARRAPGRFRRADRDVLNRNQSEPVALQPN